MRLVLGSASPGRQQVLKELGYEFEVRPAVLDEKVIRDEDPEQLALKLAQAKAKTLRPTLSSDEILITADSFVVIQGEILEKPRDESDHRRMLTLLSEFDTDNVSALCVTDGSTGREVCGTDRVSVRFRPLPAELIGEAVRNPELQQSAGGWQIQSPLFRPYLKELRGEESSLIGLPATLLKRLLDEVGHDQEDI